ncbi:MAG: GIY-YIG nuclease family protein [Alphaproteobacteria bacterium]|nr:GIY-YIG nuclease family protein [Alphaproteobacteria bacterium]
MSFGARPSLCSGLAPQDDEHLAGGWKGGWVYLLRCSDRSLYTGFTSYRDVETRVAEHNDAKYIGYTSYRRPVALVWAKWFDDLRNAHVAERRLKGWSRTKKEALVAANEDKLSALSKRRAGRPPYEEKPKSRRELSGVFQAVGSRHPEVRPGAKRRRAPKDD